jgi:tetratricopeptide (TPR) repeat protein
MNPDDPEIKLVLYSNRAQCYLNLKQYVDAEKDALSALRIDHLHMKSLLRHGTALYYLKRFKEAKWEFNNMLIIEPSNKNGQEYLRHTDQKLSKIKLEAYEKLYYGEIVGNTTSKSVSVIITEEINLDPKQRQQMEEQKEKIASKKLIEEVEEAKNGGVRESKTEFLTKTDVSNIARNKGERKDVDEFVENKEELEELKRLEEERKNDSKKRRKRKDRKKKNKNTNIDQNVEDQPSTTQETQKQEKSDVQLSFSLNAEDKKNEDHPVKSVIEDLDKVEEKPKISFNTTDGNEGEELESQTNGEGTPETFDEQYMKHMKTMKVAVHDEIKNVIDSSLPSLFIGEDIIDFEHAHEVHLDRDKPIIKERIKAE